MNINIISQILLPKLDLIQDPADNIHMVEISHRRRN